MSEPSDPYDFDARKRISDPYDYDSPARLADPYRPDDAGEGSRGAESAPSQTSTSAPTAVPAAAPGGPGASESPRESIRVGEIFVPRKTDPGTPSVAFDEKNAQGVLDQATPGEYPAALAVAAKAVRQYTDVIPSSVVDTVLENVHHLGILDPADYARRYGWQALAWAGQVLPNPGQEGVLGDAAEVLQELYGIYGGDDVDTSDPRNFETDSKLIHYAINQQILGSSDAGGRLIGDAAAVYDAWKEGSIGTSEAYQGMADALTNTSTGVMFASPKEDVEISPRRQMRENLYAAVADGTLHEKGIENISLNYYDFARGEADTLKEKVPEFVFTAGGLLPGVPYMMGRDIVDAMLTKEEARRYAREATTEVDRLYFEALSTEVGREIVGVGYELVYDPMWFVGPVKGAQVIQKGAGGARVLLNPVAARAGRVMSSLDEGATLNSGLRTVADLASSDEPVAKAARELVETKRDALRLQAAAAKASAAEAADLVGQANLESLTSRLKARAMGRPTGEAAVNADRVSEYSQALKDALEASQKVVDEIEEGAKYGREGARSADLAAAKRTLDAAKKALEEGADASSIALSGRRNLLTYRVLKKQADELDAVLRQLDSSSADELVREAGRFAVTNPLTGRTEFLSQLPGVQPVVRKVSGTVERTLEPLRYESILKKITAQLDGGAPDLQAAKDALSGAEQYALLAHELAPRLQDIYGATWNTLRQVLGTRHLQPRFAQIADAVERSRLIKSGKLLSSRVEEALVGSFDVVGTRMLKMRRLNPEIWERYDTAVNRYFQSLASNKATLLQSQRRYVALAQRITAERKKAWREYGDLPPVEELRDRLLQEQKELVNIRSRGAADDTRLMQESINKTRYELQLAEWGRRDYSAQDVIDEAADLIGTGAGVLDARPELRGLIKSMDSLVEDIASRPDVSASVEEVKQALVAVARWARGNPEVMRLHQRELDGLERLAIEAAKKQKINKAVAVGERAAVQDTVDLKIAAAQVAAKKLAEELKTRLAMLTGKEMDPRGLEGLADLPGIENRLVEGLKEAYETAVRAKELEVGKAQQVIKDLRAKHRSDLSGIKESYKEAKSQILNEAKAEVEAAKKALDDLKSEQTKAVEEAGSKAKSDYHGPNGRKNSYVAQEKVAKAAEAKVKDLEKQKADAATIQEAREAAASARSLANSLKNEKAFVASKVNEAKAQYAERIDAARADLAAQKASQKSDKDEVAAFGKQMDEALAEAGTDADAFFANLEEGMAEVRAVSAKSKEERASAKAGARASIDENKNARLAVVKQAKADAEAALEESYAAAIKSGEPQPLSGQPAVRARELRRMIVEAQPRLAPPAKVNGVIRKTDEAAFGLKSASPGRSQAILNARKTRLVSQKNEAVASGNVELAEQLDKRIARIDEQSGINTRQEDLKASLAADVEALKAEKQAVRADHRQQRAAVTDSKELGRINKSEANQLEVLNAELADVRQASKNLDSQKFVLEAWEEELWMKWRQITGQTKTVVVGSGVSKADLGILDQARDVAKLRMDEFADTINKTSLNKLTAPQRRQKLDEAQRLRQAYNDASSAAYDARNTSPQEVDVKVQYSQEEMLLAAFAVMRNADGASLLKGFKDNPLLEGLSLQYPQLVTKRLGDLPDEMVPLVAEMSRIFKSYEKLYQEHGMDFVKNPVAMLQDWGVINYVPHVTTPSTRIQSTGTDAGVGRGRGVDRSLDLGNDAHKRRTLGGTIAEINLITGDAARVMQVDPVAISSRYLQANRALAADDLLKTLTAGGVIRVLNPVDGKSIPQQALELDLVPLMDSGGAKQQNMTELIINVLDDDNAVRAMAKDDLASLKRLRGELQAARQADKAPLATFAGDSKTHAQATNIERMYAYLRLSDAIGDQARASDPLLQASIASNAKVKPTDLREVKATFVSSGMTDQEAWDSTAEMFNRLVSEAGLRDVETSGVYLANYFGDNPTPSLNRMYVPRVVRQSLEESFDNKLTEGIKDWMQGGMLRRGASSVWKGVNNFWKTRQTIIATAFHSTNVLGNKLAEMMDIGIGGAFSLRTNAIADTVAALAPYMDRYGGFAAAEEALSAAPQPEEAVGIWNRLSQTAARRRGFSHKNFRARVALLRVMAGNLDPMGKVKIYGKASATEVFDMGDGVPRTFDEIFALMRNKNVIAEAYQQVIDLDQFADDMTGLMDKSNYTAQGFRELGRKWFTARKAMKGLSAAEDVILSTVPNVLTGGIPVAVPKKFGESLGRRLENLSRVNNFVAGLRQGRSVDEAAASVQKFLFDYSDLTEVQRAILRTVIPFWTWTHKNVMLQIDQAYTNPAYAASYYKLMQQGMPRITEAYVQEKEVAADQRMNYAQPRFNRSEYIRGIPEYARFRHTYRVGTDQFVFGLRTPVESAVEQTAMLFDTAGLPLAVVNSLRNNERIRLETQMDGILPLQVLAQSHVLLRLLVELGTERSLYYGTNLKEQNSSESVKAIYMTTRERQEQADQLLEQYLGLSEVMPDMAEAFRQATGLSVNYVPGEDEAFATPLVSYGMNLMYGRMINEVAAATSMQQHAVTRSPRLYDRATRADARSSFWMMADGLTGINVKASNPQQQREVQQYIINSALDEIYVQEGLLDSTKRVYFRE